MRKQLTDRQQAIFDFIVETVGLRGAPPTIREIMDEFAISSTNGVRTTLAALEKKGTFGATPACPEVSNWSITWNRRRSRPR